MSDNKRKKKKTASLTGLIVSMMAWNTIVLMLAVLAISCMFFYRQITSVYDEMDKAIAGVAASQTDGELIEKMAVQCDELVQSYDDIMTAFNEDPQEVYDRFDTLERTEGYEKLRDMLNTMRRSTDATEIDLVLFYPDRELGVYIMDARDVTLVEAGETFPIGRKYFDKYTGLFKGFYSKSRYFGTLRTNGIPIYIDDERGICTYLTVDIPTSRIDDRVIMFVINSGILAVVISALICAGIAYLLRRRAVKPIRDLISKAGEYVDGYENRSSVKESSYVFSELNESNIAEIKELQSALGSMELEMNSYLSSLDSVTREQERIRTELDMAAGIQAAVLPRVFPPFPERTEFDIYASMTPAKEVGGDFYDFFLTDEDHLGLVMADVSGKGVPAALFMMVSKILIQNYAMSGMGPAEVLETVNDKLCANNEYEMFVTVWLGILEISTGRITAANAGHEYPVIRKADGDFELYKDKHGFVVAGMPGMKYKEYEITLEKGGTLFLYTDGVPEATDPEKELFGTERMLAALNKEPDASTEILLKNVHDAADTFTGTAEQFDDLTMLAVHLSKR